MTDLGMGFEERDMQVAIWVLVVVDLRFWVVTVDISVGRGAVGGFGFVAPWVAAHRGSWD